MIKNVDEAIYYREINVARTLSILCYSSSVLLLDLTFQALYRLVEYFPFW